MGSPSFWNLSAASFARGRSGSSVTASITASVEAPEVEKATRHDSYVAAGRQKRQEAISSHDHGAYYASLLATSAARQDTAAARDLKQIDKDLKRTFSGLECPEGVDA